MGRTAPSVGLAPQSLRKERRAKEARATANKVIPSILASDPRARRGVENSELILNPPPPNWSISPMQQEAPNDSERRTSNRQPKPAKSRLKSRRKTSICEEDSFSSLAATSAPQSQDTQLQVRIQNCTLLHAVSLLRCSKDNESHGHRSKLVNIGVLNPASPLRPGGGFLNGATSGEETLCTFTTLYPSLKEEFYRLPELGGIWTTDVLVFRPPPSANPIQTRPHVDTSGDSRDVMEGTKILNKSERWYINVLSAGMLRFPEVETVFHGTEEYAEQDAEEMYVHSKDRELVIKKIEAVMRIFASKGCEKIVIPPWGCGSYGNPVGEIARAWRFVLFASDKKRKFKNEHTGQTNNKAGDRESRWPGVKEIIFAINERKMAEDFARAFGRDLKVDYVIEGKDIGRPEVIESSAEVVELESRIAEMETTIEQVRNPDLHYRLTVVLADLKHQLTALSDPVHKQNVSMDLEEEDDSNEENELSVEENDVYGPGSDENVHDSAEEDTSSEPRTDHVEKFAMRTNTIL